jgi:hypothetical protein
VAEVEVAVPLLVLLEVTLFVEGLLVVEVIKVVVTLCVVITAAGVHCAYPRSCDSALISLHRISMVLNSKGGHLQEFCVLQLALATQTVGPDQPIPPPINQVRVKYLRIS